MTILPAGTLRTPEIQSKSSSHPTLDLKVQQLKPLKLFVSLVVKRFVLTSFDRDIPAREKVSQLKGHRGF